jgi:hypothetical protein
MNFSTILSHLIKHSIYGLKKLDPLENSDKTLTTPLTTTPTPNEPSIFDKLFGNLYPSDALNISSTTSSARIPKYSPKISARLIGSGSSAAAASPILSDNNEVYELEIENDSKTDGFFDSAKNFIKSFFNQHDDDITEYFMTKSASNTNGSIVFVNNSRLFEILFYVCLVLFLIILVLLSISVSFKIFLFINSKN